MFLVDKDILKLMIGFCLTCNLPSNPLWLFIASGSSAGKTMLIELFEKVSGFTQVDNMTGNSLQSGMKRSDKSPSFLQRIPPNGFIVFKDFTVMMSKNPEVLAEIMGQLRIVFDGSSVKITGGLEENQKWTGKVSMLGAGTGVLYSKNEQFADMGQRMVIYNYIQPDDYAVSAWMKKHQKDDSKAKKEELQLMIKKYIESIPVSSKFEDLPHIDDETWDDLTDIAHLSTTARSPVTRNKFSRNNEILDKGLKEAFTRMFKQLIVTSYGLMLQNPDKKLTSRDKKILFKLGLDCVDPKKMSVLQALTKFNLGGGSEEIAEEIGFTKGSAEQFVEDLMVHGMVKKERVPYHNGKKTIYKIKDKYKEIIMKFEGIVPEDKAMTLEDSIPLPTPPPEEVGVPIERIGDLFH